MIVVLEITTHEFDLIKLVLLSYKNNKAFCVLQLDS